MGMTFARILILAGLVFVAAGTPLLLGASVGASLCLVGLTLVAEGVFGVDVDA